MTRCASKLRARKRLGERIMASAGATCLAACAPSGDLVPARVVYAVEVEAAGTLGTIDAERIDDVDGDGARDYLVSIPTAEGDLGVVRVVSARRGITLRQEVGDGANDNLGEVLASLGDLDRDGTRDYAYSTRDAWLAVRSGRSGLPIEFARLAKPDGESLITSISDCGDVNGDGIPDVLLGVARTNARAAWVVSGTDGRTLAAIPDSFWGPLEDSYWFDWYVEVLGIPDVDQDGWPDLLVGFPPPRYEARGNRCARDGVAGVFSVRDASLIEAIRSPTRDQDFACSARLVGDLDGDGKTDFAIGAESSVTVYSLASGLEIRRIEQSGREAGASFDGGADLDGDGTPDLLVVCRNANLDSGRPFGVGGGVRFFSGKDAHEIGSLSVTTCNTSGIHACFLDDVDDDARPDVAVVVPGEDRSELVVVSGASVIAREAR